MSSASKFLLIALLAIMAVGCGHAQVKPTQYQVTLSWQAPVPVPGGQGWQTPCSGAGSVACTYFISRAAAVSGSCPAVNEVVPNYSPLNAASPATGLSFNDTGAAGSSVCYAAQTQQSGVVGHVSNVAGPFVVPGTPLAPTLSGAQQVASASLLTPEIDAMQMALVGRITPIR